MSIVAAFMVPHPPLIIPDVGKGGEKQIEATTRAYNQVAETVARLKPDTIVVSSPHSIMYADYFHISPGVSASGSFAEFGAPNVRFDLEYDSAFTRKLTEYADSDGFPAGTLGERRKALDHGTMVPLWFILQKYSGFRLVRAGLSGLSLRKHYEFGRYFQKAAKDLDRRTVFIASGDLSHKLQEYGPYGFAKEGPEYDARIMDVCGNARFGELFAFDEAFLDRAAECGHRSFVIMAGALDGMSLETQKLSHEDVTGVGYGICSFIVTGNDESRRFL